MKWLTKMFGKKKPTYSNNNIYKLLVIDEDAELLHENLGITEKRADELLKACADAYENNNVLYGALGDMVDECKHVNELVLSALMMQKIIDKHKSSDRVHNLLKNMFGRG